jgi:RNA polymerase sigma-70 factor (ECF subfamily)
MSADNRVDRTIAASLAHDVDAGFEPFVKAYQDRLYAYALNLTVNSAVAEDVAQEAFVAAYRALKKYAPERRRALALRAWLYTIALNLVRNLARSPAKKHVSLDGHGAAGRQLVFDIVEPSAGPARRAEQRETAGELRAALARLSLRYRGAVVLRHVEGRAYAEIASILGQPVGTVKSDVHRGLALLRADLKGKHHAESTSSLG